MSAVESSMMPAPLISPDDGTAAVVAPAPVEIPDYRRRFTVQDIRRLDRLGFFKPGERIELIDGDIVVMSRIGSLHAACTKGLARRFISGLGDRATIGIQDPIHLSDTFEPEPDVSIAKFRPDNYAGGHPTAADLLLVVEIMDSSGPYDRGVKIPLYARDGIPETWLVDLPNALIERHRRPSDGIYCERLILRPGQTISPEAFPDVVLAVESILGRPEA